MMKKIERFNWEWENEEYIDIKFVKKVISSLENIKKYHFELLNLWIDESNLSEDDINLNDYLSNNYPFKNSFDENCDDIMVWVNESIEKLKKDYNIK